MDWSILAQPVAVDVLGPAGQVPRPRTASEGAAALGRVRVCGNPNQGRVRDLGYKTCKSTEKSYTGELLLRNARIQLKGARWEEVPQLHPKTSPRSPATAAAQAAGGIAPGAAPAWWVSVNGLGRALARRLALWF